MTKSIFAAAFSRIDDTTIDAFVAEIKVMTPLRHPNVIFFYGGVWTQGADRICLVLEFAGRGSLDGWIGKDEVAWPESESSSDSSRHGKNIAIDTAHGLAYLHGRDPPLVHRDVKPGNVMLVASFAAKIGDLGETKANKQKSDKGLATIVGSPMYVAPEVVRAERYGEPADVFSFALVLLELVTGVSTEHRFKQMGIARKGVSSHHEKGKRADLAFVEQTGSKGAALRLVEQCWDHDPSKRPKMKECGRILVAMEEESGEKAPFVASFAVEPELEKEKGGAVIEEKSDSDDETESLREQIEALKQGEDTLKKRLAEKDKLIAKKDNIIAQNAKEITELRRRLHSGPSKID